MAARPGGKLLLTAKQIDYWPDDCADDLLNIYGHDISKYDTIATFGCSMGGWGALRHAARLGASKVLCLSPRTKWCSKLRRNVKAGPPRPFHWPSTTDVTVIRDPGFKTDVVNCRALATLGKIRVLNAPGCGHDKHWMLRQNTGGPGVFGNWLNNTLTQDITERVCRALKRRKGRLVGPAGFEPATKAL